MDNDKTSLKVKIRNSLPMAIILFVSGSAFVAGYYQNGYSERSRSFRQEAVYQQKIASEMWNTIYRIFNDEMRILIDAKNLQTLAENLIIEYLALASTLTPEMAESYLNRIAYNYWHMEQSLEGSWSYFIYRHFEIENTEDPYNLAVFPELNYVCQITKTMYYSTEPTIRSQSALEFFNETLLNTGNLSTDEEYIIPLIIETPYMPSTINHPTLTWMDILFDIIIEKTELAHQLTAKADRVDQISDTMAIGVSITTVASILTVAMANRFDKKTIEYQFSLIRADILNDETLIVPAKEKLGAFVLITAGVISVVGVLWPLYLTTLPLDITEVPGGSLRALLFPTTTTTPTTPTTIFTPPTTAIVTFATVPELLILDYAAILGIVSLLFLSLLYRRYHHK